MQIVAPGLHERMRKVCSDRATCKLDLIHGRHARVRINSSMHLRWDVKSSEVNQQSVTIKLEKCVLSPTITKYGPLANSFQ